MKLNPFDEYWLARGEMDGYDHDLMIARSGDPDEDWAVPPSAALARLEHAVAEVADLQAQALSVIRGIRPQMGEERWMPFQFRIAADGTLWIDFVEWDSDEYSLWAVRFDPTDRPDEVRRQAFQLPPNKPDDKDRLMWRA